MNETGNEITTPNQSGEGSESETDSLAEQLREEREKLEAVRKDIKSENDRAEKILARQALGGDSEAGQTKVKPKEETDKEYRQRVEKELSEGQHAGK